MFERIQSVVLLALVMVGLSSCGDDGVVVWLHLKNIPGEMTALQVTLMLDGKPATQPYEFMTGIGEVAITLQRAQLGQGLLKVNLTGLSVGRCKVATGTYAAMVNTDTPYSESDVTLAAVSPVTCLLTVEKAGTGSVVSNPAGVNCGTTCTMEVPVGTKVALSATTAIPFSGSFWNGCSGWNDTCELTVTMEKKVAVQFGPEVRPKLVDVPKGNFTMGSPPSEPGRGTDELQHSSELTTGFGISESEVTQRQYLNLMGGNPSFSSGNELPVEQVTWFEAVTYCNALSAKEYLTPCYQINGMTVGWSDGVKCTGYRLPTEAEWEYAASSATPPRTVYAGSDTVDGVAWTGANSGGRTHAVKAKTANGRGLYDLSGNVWEWVWDFYQSNYETLPSIDPIGPPTGVDRVIRGGSWGDPAANARVAARLKNSPTGRIQYIGFRVVRSHP